MNFIEIHILVQWDKNCILRCYNLPYKIAGKPNLDASKNSCPQRCDWQTLLAESAW